MQVPNTMQPYNTMRIDTGLAETGVMIRDGLADYEILKYKFIIFILFLCILSALYSMYSTNKEKYVLTNGIISNSSISNGFSNQTLNYTVNNVVYTVPVPFNKKSYPNGNIKVYYSKSNPQKFQLNNPMNGSKIWIGLSSILFVCAIAWYFFIKQNKNVAAISGFSGSGSSGLGSGLGMGMGFGIGDAIGSSFDL
jgi:hypothetical protein